MGIAPTGVSRPSAVGRCGGFFCALDEGAGAAAAGGGVVGVLAGFVALLGPVLLLVLLVLVLPALSPELLVLPWAGADPADVAPAAGLPSADGAVALAAADVEPLGSVGCVAAAEDAAVVLDVGGADAPPEVAAGLVEPLLAAEPLLVEPLLLEPLLAGVMAAVVGGAAVAGDDSLPELAPDVSWFAGADCAAVPDAGAVTVWVTEPRTDPSVPVTGAVTACSPVETPDVSPDSNEGWLVVAALATPAGSHRRREIPPLAIVNRTVKRVTRRVCCFDIDNPRLTDGRRRAYCTVTTVQQSAG